jgi:hypothetical protein
MLERKNTVIDLKIIVYTGHSTGKTQRGVTYEYRQYNFLTNYGFCSYA